MKNTIKAELTLSQALELYKYYEWQARSQAETDEDIDKYIKLSDDMENQIKKVLIEKIENMKFWKVENLDELVRLIETSKEQDEEPVSFETDDEPQWTFMGLLDNEENQMREVYNADRYNNPAHPGQVLCVEGEHDGGLFFDVKCVPTHMPQIGEKVCLDVCEGYITNIYYVSVEDAKDMSNLVYDEKRKSWYKFEEYMYYNEVLDHTIVHIVNPKDKTYKCFWGGLNGHDPVLGEEVEATLKSGGHIAGIIYKIETYKSTRDEYMKALENKEVDGHIYTQDEKIPF